MFEIERGIPIPENKRHSEYPWSKLEVGDSFVVEGDKKTAKSLRVTGWDYGRRHRPFKIIVRQETDKTVRVWRVQ